MLSYCIKITLAEGIGEKMLKVVVFDSGYGGELFADYLQDNLPIIEIIRVIDWRNAEKILSRAKDARKVAEVALRPYIGKVDLIIFANYLLSITSLKYFRRKYKTQKFLGLQLPHHNTGRDTLVLTTKAVAKTINYYNFIFHLSCRSKTLALDSWPAKIDDGELTSAEISDSFRSHFSRESFRPQDIILACAQFNDIKAELKACLGGNPRFHDGFYNALIKTCKILQIRGGVGKKKT